MRKGPTIALLLLASVGFWVAFGDSSPSTRPSPAAEAVEREDREFRERLRRIGPIAFSRSGARPGERDVWTMDGDGTRQIRRTTTGRDSLPSWSSDGSRLAYLHRDLPDDGPGRVFVLDPAGGAPRKLSDTPVLADESPRWSPDDRFIAFTHPARDEGVLHHEVRVVEVSTGKETIVGPGSHPRWSPDGRLIASSLGMADLAGAPRVRVPEGDDFAWSPDGTRAAFVRALDGGPPTALHLMDAEGGIVRRLTRHDWVDQSPAWSPDGRSVAFFSRDPMGMDVAIGIVSTEGVAGPSPGAGVDPVWTADGRGVVFTAVPSGDTPRQIWYVETDGKRRLNLSRSDVSDGEPALRRHRP